jgi:membrane fusion protein (multidrug efflux system)
MTKDVKQKAARTARVAMVALLTAASAACGGGDDEASANPATATPIAIGQENIVIVRQGVIQSGPAISGSLRPLHEASVRAEVAGPLVQVFAETGQAVGAGQAIAKIDDSAIRDQVISAQSALRSAGQTLELARRNAERAQKLADAGAVAERDLESARFSVTSAQAQVSDAQSRLALAQKQLNNTVVRSPMRGVVSERPANAGDVVQPGTALFTIVDPGAMRLVAAVPSEQLGTLRLGAPVNFTVSGYPGRTFVGRIERISPTADPATRQVPIYVALPNTGNQLVSGLFAEGRVAAESRTGLVVPLNAVEVSGASTFVIRVKGGRVARVQVQPGLRDEQTESLQIMSGVASGDTLLIGSAQGITPGTPVRVQAVSDSRMAR